MSEKDRQNLSEKDHGSDDTQIENFDVGNTEAILDNTIEVNHNSPGNAHHILQQNAIDGTEVNPIDVITVEEISHKSLEENVSETCQYKVQFPSDEEKCVDNMDSVSFQASSEESNDNSFFLASIHKRKGERIEVVDTESLNKKAPNVTSATETWRDSERKRKKGGISVKQNKRQKEIEDSCIPITQCSSTEDTIEAKSSSSGEFADSEDSSSSDNNGLYSSKETAKQKPSKGLSSDIQQRKETKNESLNQKKFAKGETSCISHINASQNDQFEDKTEDTTFFSLSMKGETLPAFKLTDEAKKKFELSMPTIFEVRESESDEKLLQPLQSKTNPLKMKTKVVKRKDKCNVCNVRLGLCAIECRCGGFYCAKHRYDKEHNCTFDYKQMGAAEIRKNNPRIVAEKIRKL